MRILFTYILLTLTLVLSSYSGESKILAEKINSVIAPFHAQIGVAVLHNEKRDSCVINNKYHYVMQSVYKFHLAVTVLHMVDEGKLSLNQQVVIPKKELQQDTWSPIAEKYKNGDATLTVREILSYTISQSDNIGCDVLFKLVGGTKVVHNYMKQLGITNVAIKATEQQMHENGAKAYTNWTTPSSAAEILQKAYTPAILSESSKKELWKMMEETTTGPKRIKGLLPADAVVGHKTGSSGQDSHGVSVATNDIGMITLPNGEHVFLAVFVNESSEKPDTNDEIIAKIARVVWDYYITK